MLRKVAAKLLPLVPRRIVARVARPYIAGETIDEAVARVASLMEQGLEATVDLLGENVESEAVAAEVTEEYLALLDAFAARDWRAHLSVKLTHLGLRLSEDIAHRNALRLLERAAAIGGFVRLDMEDSSTTDATLGIFRRLREQSDRVGVAIQAYLHRSLADVSDLLDLRPNIRVCKGIYPEPPRLALQGFREIQTNFLALVRLVLSGGGFVAVATHDTHLLRSTREICAEFGAGSERHEYQMLLGVREELWPGILSGGDRLRIYCPYGPDWYDYSLRRLAENPRLLGHVARSALRVRPRSGTLA